MSKYKFLLLGGVVSLFNFNSYTSADSISDGFNSFVNRFVSLGNSITAVLSYVWSIFKTLWYGLTSLLTGVWDLVADVWHGSLGFQLGSTFGQLTDYIGGPAVIFITSLFLIIIFRIGLAFVFKLLRLNIDYRTLNDKNDRVEKRAKAQHK